MGFTTIFITHTYLIRQSFIWYSCKSSFVILSLENTFTVPLSKNIMMKDNAKRLNLIYRTFLNEIIELFVFLLPEK